MNEIFEVLRNEKLSNDFYLLEVLFPNYIQKPIPGQFYQIKVNFNGFSHDPLMRRPLSVHDFDEESGILSFVYRVVGRGTKSLTKLVPGDKIDVLGPLGRGFRTDFMQKTILIVGGGMGVVPLYYLSKVLSKSNQLMLFLGFSSSEETAYFKELFKNLRIKVNFSTIDGSFGLKGTVMDLIKEKNELFKGEVSWDYIFSCGPRPMLKRVIKFAKKHSIPGQVSLEERMACGIGVCLSCICKSGTGNKRVCMEGPVFSIQDVILDEGDEDNV